VLGVPGELPDDRRIGAVVVYQKAQRVKTAEEVLSRAERAVQVPGVERVLLNAGCGLAAYSDSPVASTALAKGRLAAVAEAARRLRHRHGLAA